MLYPNGIRALAAISLALPEAVMAAGYVPEPDDARPILNPAGDVQGGFLAAMLDDTLGPALVATLEDGQWAPTIDLQIQFLRPVKPGVLRGFGRVVRRGKGVAFLAGELQRADGAVVATATASAMIRTR